MASIYRLVASASLLLLLLMTLPGSRYGVAADSSSTNQRLLVFLVDGFRWDYVDKFNLLNFKRLLSRGAKADYLLNDFPTLSYPNYYTLMTGLHTESHGMTGNFMYDPATRKYFLIGTNPDQYLPLWWENGEPLWVTAVRQQKSAYMFYWLGCEVTIRGFVPTFCEKYTKVPTLQEVSDALSKGIELLTNGTADMVGVYSEQPDYEGHKYGPNDNHTRDAVRGLDTQIGKVLDSLDALDDGQKFDLIVFSDHGMTQVDPSRVINITDALNSEPDLYVTVMENAALASVYAPDQEAEDKVYSALKNMSVHMRVYRQSEIPDRFFYKHGPFVSRITCVADLGWTILQPLTPEFPMKGDNPFKGHHGFDNKYSDMRGIFYATGPYFKAGSSVSHIRAIDPYSVMCDILGLQPAPNNGTLSVFEPLTAVSAGERPLTPEFPMKGDNPFKGHHGFDNKYSDMRGIFYATGPYFKAGRSVSHIRAIDPYSVMCDILGLQPAPNNGTLSVFEPLTAVSAGERVTTSATGWLCALLLHMLVLGIHLV